MRATAVRGRARHGAVSKGCSENPWDPREVQRVSSKERLLWEKRSSQHPSAVRLAARRLG